MTEKESPIFVSLFAIDCTYRVLILPSETVAFTLFPFSTAFSRLCKSLASFSTLREIPVPFEFTMAFGSVTVLLEEKEECPIFELLVFPASIG